MTDARHTPLLAGLLVLAVTFVVTSVRYGPPHSSAESAAPTVFSGARARAIHERLLPAEEPHPIGTPAITRVRERVLRELGRLGVATDVQDIWYDSGSGRVVRIRNVVARLPGSAQAGDRAPVLLVSHYDSVGAGPGASDDGAGMATLLEIARALRAGPPLNRPVVLLFDEGEEAGLLGARAFMDEHPLAQRIHAVINVEARGTSGPSLMFETGPNNLALIRLMARSIVRPNTSSLFYSFYRAMPNDTDFTVFKKHGLSGYNFAFIGNPAYYHTPHDNLKNADVRSLQHHGDNALSLVRALASDESITADDDAVFFDVASFAIVRWPQSWTIPLAVLALLAVLANFGLETSRRILLRRSGIALVAWLGVIGLTAVLGHGTAFALLPAREWLLLPGWLTIGSYALAVGATLLVGRIAHRLGFWPLWYGAWIGIGLAGVTIAVVMPGASYVFIVPALCAGLCGLLARTLRRDEGRGSLVAGCAPLVPLGFVLFPIGYGLADGFGPNVSLLAAVVVSPTIALAAMSRAAIVRRWGLVSVALTVVTCIATVALPRSTSLPHRASLVHHQIGGKATWYVAPSGPRVPRSVASPLATRPAHRIGQAHRRFIQVAEVPGPAVAALPPPTLSVTSSRPVARGRRFRLQLTSARSAPIATVLFPSDFLYGSVYVRADGERFRASLEKRGGQAALTCLSVPPDGIEIDITIRPKEGAFAGLGVSVSDVSYGLPPSGEPLRNARDAIAVPHRDGDVTIVTAVASIPAE